MGSALKEVFAHYDVERKDVWLTTKLWNNDHASSRVEPAARKSMKLLGVDYLDALLIHWPITGNRGEEVTPSIKETWQAMEALVDKGLVRHLGVSNFSVKKMEQIRGYARVPLSICQCECHPFFRNDAVVTFCLKNNIHFTGAPLSSRARLRSLIPRRRSLFAAREPGQQRHLPPRRASAAGGTGGGGGRLRVRKERWPGAHQVGAAGAAWMLRPAKVRLRPAHPGQRGDDGLGAGRRLHGCAQLAGHTDAHGARRPVSTAERAVPDDAGPVGRGAVGDFSYPLLN